jgi:DNA-directed RNA polymerase subunit omega
MVERLEKVLSRALESVDGDTYLLSIVVAKRSEQLSNGDEPLLDEEFLKSNQLVKPADIALYEVAENLLDYKIS